MARLSPNGKATYLDKNGNPLAGGKIYTYINGTTTPKDTYIDEVESDTNANPVILDARGQADIWYSETGGYKVAVYDANDNLQYVTDRIFENQEGADTTDVVIDDNTASAYRVRESTNNYINIDTTDDSEVMSFGNTVTNPNFNFLGSGDVDFSNTGDVRIVAANLLFGSDGSEKGRIKFDTDLYIENLNTGGNADIYITTLTGNIICAPIGEVDFNFSSSTVAQVDDNGFVATNNKISLGADVSPATLIRVPGTSVTLLTNTTESLVLSTSSGVVYLSPNGQDTVYVDQQSFRMASDTHIWLGNTAQSTGDVAINGYVLVKDYTGATIKLATVA